eukprot:scaffold40970_cov200-Skeletonema_dohrnii-CCMP3373.AAC.3
MGFSSAATTTIQSRVEQSRLPVIYCHRNRSIDQGGVARKAVFVLPRVLDSHILDRCYITLEHYSDGNGL